MLIYLKSKDKIQAISIFCSRRKVMELEEELKVVGNSLKSLEVSEEKV